MIENDPAPKLETLVRGPISASPTLFKKHQTGDHFPPRIDRAEAPAPLTSSHSLTGPWLPHVPGLLP